MGNSLGNASLVLSTAGGKLTSGLNEAHGEIKGFAGKASGGVAGAFSGIGGKLAGFMKAGPHVAAIAMIGTTILEAISHPFDKLKELRGVQKGADTLGISASSLQGLSAVMARVGIEGEEVNNVLLKMGKNVADAAGGHGKAAPAFKQLGIDGKALLELPIDEQFKSIADSIGKLPPGAAQASAALHIFGEQGGELLPILQKGSKGIEEYVAKMKATGAVLSDPQIKAAADAAKAWKESKLQITAVWTGLVNRATLIAAPVVKLLGGLVSKAFALLTPVFEWLGRALERAAVIIEAVGEVLGKWVDEAIAVITELIGSVFSFGDSWPSIETVVTAVLKTVAMSIGYVWDTLKAGVGAMAYVTSFIVKGFGVIVDALKATIKDALDLGAALPDELGGAKFRKWKESVDGWGGKIDAAGDRMKEWGKGAMGSWGDSAKSIGTWFDKLDFKRKEQVKGAKSDMKDMAALEYKPTAAILKGSKEAYSIETKFAFDSKQKDAKEKQLDEAKKTNGLLGNIAEALKNAPTLKAG